MNVCKKTKLKKETVGETNISNTEGAQENHQGYSEGYKGVFGGELIKRLCEYY